MQPAEITIVVPNTLQRDLTKEVYSKKRAVSDKFADFEPHVISAQEVQASLPLEVAIYADLKTEEGDQIWSALESLA